LKEILLDFYQRMADDIFIGFFFAGKDVRAISSKQADFLLYAMGEQPQFHGKHPSDAHLGMPPILKGHFDRRILILKETLQVHQLEIEDIRTWVEFEQAFEDVIVTK
jgi:truncated hemoglobin YjbI